MAMTAEARSLVQEKPARAWKRALQAVRLLGDPDLPNGVTSPAVRAEAEGDAPRHRGQAPGRWSARRSETGRDLRGGPGSAVRNRERSGSESLVDARRLDVRASGSPIDLLDAALGLQERGGWLCDALVPVAQTLRHGLETSARDPREAGYLDDEIEAWLDLTGFAGDLDAEGRRLRVLAGQTLLGAGALDEAERVLHGIVPAELALVARLQEARGLFTEAAETFEKIGASDDALRNWRRSRTGIGHFALVPAGLGSGAGSRVAPGPREAYLQTASGLLARLTEGEKARLGEVLGAVEGGSKKGSPGRARKDGGKHVDR